MILRREARRAAPSAAREAPRAALGVAVAIAAIGLASCGGHGAAGRAGSSSPPAVVPRSAARTTGARNPLTGLPGQPRPVVVVKVDNVYTGTQTGLNSTDVVYCELVEGGLTRLVAVYSSTTPTSVGPVRSARESDLELLGQYGRVALASSGANTGVTATENNANVRNDSYDAQTSAYTFSASRPSPYRFLVNVAQLAQTAPGAKARDVGFRFGRAPAATSAHPAPATAALTVPYPAVTIGATWDARSKTWLIARDGAPRRLEDGSQVATTNILVQYVQVGTSRYTDHNGAPTPTLATVGSGPALLLRDGKRYAGTWTRAKATAPTTWTSAGGGALTLNPGRTWVLLVPAGTGLQYR